MVMWNLIILLYVSIELGTSWYNFLCSWNSTLIPKGLSDMTSHLKHDTQHLAKTISKIPMASRIDQWLVKRSMSEYACTAMTTIASVSLNEIHIGKIYPTLCRPYAVFSPVLAHLYEYQKKRENLWDTSLHFFKFIEPQRYSVFAASSAKQITSPNALGTKKNC